MNGLYITIPFFGTTSVLALIVSPLCVTFAIVWAVYRHTSCAWVAQDILVSIPPHPEYHTTHMYICTKHVIMKKVEMDEPNIMVGPSSNYHIT